MTELREDFLIRLNGLIADGAPWHQIGQALRDRPEYFDAPAWRRLVSDIARESGYAPVMFPRYVALYNRITAIAGSSLEIASLLPPTFTGGEIAVRLYDRNQEKGLQALRNLRQRRTTIGKLRDDLSKEPLPEKRELRGSWNERAKVIANAEILLSRKAARTGNTVVRRQPLPHFSRTGFEVLSKEGRRLAGIDLYLPDLTQNLTQDPLEPIAKSVLLSLYFPRFHLMFAHGFSEEDLARAEALLNAFDAGSIGMIVMPNDNSIAEHRPASPRDSHLAQSADYEVLADKIRDSGHWRPDRTVDEDNETPTPPQPGF